MNEANRPHEQGKKKTSHGRKLLVAALIFVGILAGVLVWQRENIDAILKFNQYSQEELEEKLEQNKQAIESVTEKLPEVNVRPATEEEKEALQSGTITKEELIQNLQKPAEESKVPEQKPAAQEKPAEEQKPDAQEKPEQSAHEKEVSEIIATVYVMREEYLIALDQLKDSAVAEYKAMTEEDKTSKKLAIFVSGYAAKALELEKECDAKMLDVVTGLENLLKENGGDVSLAQTVYDTYVEEKNLKKAWYMAELTKRGLSYS